MFIVVIFKLVFRELVILSLGIARYKSYYYYYYYYYYCCCCIHHRSYYYYYHKVLANLFTRVFVAIIK